MKLRTRVGQDIRVRAYRVFNTVRHGRSTRASLSYASRIFSDGSNRCETTTVASCGLLQAPALRRNKQPPNPIVETSYWTISPVCQLPQFLALAERTPRPGECLQNYFNGLVLFRFFIRSPRLCQANGNKFARLCKNPSLTILDHRFVVLNAVAGVGALDIQVIVHPAVPDPVGTVCVRPRCMGAGKALEGQHPKK